MSASVSPGTTIDRYCVEAEIGAGSMGDVFLASDVELGRKVAIKILSERHRDNDELRARFVREARAVAAISHPNVVQVFTTGTFDDRPYIAMEFLDGVDLGTDVKENGPWTSLQAARAICDAAHGLDGAAKAGLIHRDVKPSNLVLITSGKVKVTDFGLAKPLDPGNEPALTAMGVVVGTPDYIAPEQARGERIDERVDIYALGGTLYFLVTGIPPYRTGKKAEDKYLKVVARHLRKPPPDPRQRNATVDDEVAELVMALMAKKPAQRPSYAAFIGQLDAIVSRLEGGGTSARVPTSSGGGALISPTPYVGGSGPSPADFATGAGHAPGGAGIVHRSAKDDELDSAPTNLRVPTAPPDPERLLPTVEASMAVRRPKVSGWLIAVTILAMLVFLGGLGLLLFGPIPEPEAVSSPSPNSGYTVMPAQPTDAAAPADPEPPEGMLLVRKADGSPWLFVSARSVSWDAYRSLYPRHRKPRRAKGPSPVTNVAFGLAGSFAETRGMRLATSQEWTAASTTAGFEGPGKRRWEWVARGADDAGNRPKIHSMSTAKPVSRRSAKAHGDVTFRLARDLTVTTAP